MEARRNAFRRIERTWNERRPEAGLLSYAEPARLAGIPVQADMHGSDRVQGNTMTTAYASFPQKRRGAAPRSSEACRTYEDAMDT